MNAIINNKIIRTMVTCLVTLTLLFGIACITAEPTYGATKGGSLTAAESKTYCKVVLQDMKKPGYVTFNCTAGGGLFKATAKVVLRDKNNKWVREWVAKDGDRFYLGNNYQEYRIYLKQNPSVALKPTEWSIKNYQNTKVS